MSKPDDTLDEAQEKYASCGLSPALEVMGERWSFLILRSAFTGLVHFEEFSSELGIARNILSNRLANLVEHGVLERTPCEEDRRKVEYRLTNKGRDLLPTMLALREWGMKYCTALPTNPVLVDAKFGKPIAPFVIRSEDGRELEFEDLAWRDMKGAEEPRTTLNKETVEEQT